jgi:NAD(P)-dependent dehydrogenase (short-subunit alcohol dehydrogenase family)
VTAISRRFWRKPRCRNYRCACGGDWLDVRYILGNRQGNRSELVALRRLVTVEDRAKVVEFLATDLSDYVTGAIIPIDGGLVRG